jgi:DNA mismatch repair ATPase MutS
VKVFLMHKDQDFNMEREVPWNGPDLIQDLQLDAIFKAMADRDEFLHRVAQSALLSSLDNGPDIILYRQAVLKDCLKNPSIVQGMYKLAVDTIGTRKVSEWAAGVAHSPRALLSRSVETLKTFLATLKELRSFVDRDTTKFESEGFKEFFERIKREISNEYLGEIEEHLKDLSALDEVLIGVKLGKGNRGSNYTLRKANKQKKWIQRVFERGPKVYTFSIDDRDETEVRKLDELRNRGIDSVANTTAQSVDHILNFLDKLRTELAFYIGCIYLHDHLDKIEEPACFPIPTPTGEYKLSSEGLYDISLALSMDQQVVSNDIKADNKHLIITTGANKGGKTTFLRSVGISQMMMQCGMFVPARSFSANLCTGLFTHFRRKEDVSMESGKLDEELSRMSQIVNHLSSNSMILLNEAFASTNEREGSEITRQIVTALLERHVRVIFVTHLYQFAHKFYEGRTNECLFLRAERKQDGTRTFKLVEGEPLDTSYGIDLYNRIFITEGRKINAKVQ